MNCTYPKDESSSEHADACCALDFSKSKPLKRGPLYPNAIIALMLIFAIGAIFGCGDKQSPRQSAEETVNVFLQALIDEDVETWLDLFGDEEHTPADIEDIRIILYEIINITDYNIDEIVDLSEGKQRVQVLINYTIFNFPVSETIGLELNKESGLWFIGEVDLYAELIEGYLDLWNDLLYVLDNLFDAIFYLELATVNLNPLQDMGKIATNRAIQDVYDQLSPAKKIAPPTVMYPGTSELYFDYLDSVEMTVTILEEAIEAEDQDQLGEFYTKLGESFSLHLELRNALADDLEPWFEYLGNIEELRKP